MPILSGSLYGHIHLIYLIRKISVVETVSSMTEMTIESVFGVKAGIVWGVLDQNGPSTIGDIAKATGLRRELVYGALGWLGRENKITVERRGRAMIFSLRP